MDDLGLTWDPYQVKTEDGWFLSMFRITGEVGEQPNYMQSEHQDKLPIVMQHASFQDVDYWMSGGTASPWIKLGLIGPTLPTQLVWRGYDVWLVTNRGFTYSNVNERDGEWSLKERWDFSWADMGAYDVPAFVEKTLEVTGKPKVTLLGYS